MHGMNNVFTSHVSRLSRLVDRSTT